MDDEVMEPDEHWVDGLGVVAYPEACSCGSRRWYYLAANSQESRCFCVDCFDRWCKRPCVILGEIDGATEVYLPYDDPVERNQPRVRPEDEPYEMRNPWPTREELMAQWRRETGRDANGRLKYSRPSGKAAPEGVKDKRKGRKNRIQSARGQLYLGGT